MYRYCCPKVQLLSFSCLIVARKKSGAVGDAPEIIRNPPPNLFYLKETPFMKKRGHYKKGGFVLELKIAEA